MTFIIKPNLPLWRLIYMNKGIYSIIFIALAFFTGCGMMGGMGNDCSQDAMQSHHSGTDKSCDSPMLMALLSAGRTGGNVPSAAVPALVLAGVPGNGQVGLSWNEVSGAEYYPVYYATSAQVGQNVPGSTLVANTPGVGLIVTGLTNGTTYYFIVYAYSAAKGTFAVSNVVSAIPAGVHG